MATLGKRILAHMKAIGAEIDQLNIVCLEDSTPDGKPIPNVIDAWNDRLLVVKADGSIALNLACTTEPGSYYINNPMNSKGCARIALGFHKHAWTFGKHYKQDALVQCAPIQVYRDKNKDGFRTGDAVDSGVFMVNIHTTGNEPGHCPATIGRWSAGCTVVQSSTSFYNSFMPLMRYSGRKVFSATFIDPKELPKLDTVVA